MLLARYYGSIKAEFLVACFDTAQLREVQQKSQTYIPGEQDAQRASEAVRIIPTDVPTAVPTAHAARTAARTYIVLKK